MAIDTLLAFQNIDSTENINARLAGLVPKGILKGGIVIAEPASLQVRIVGTVGDPWVFLAFSSDGMLLRNFSQEIVLPVVAGLTNVVVIRAQYVQSGPPLASVEVLSLGDYQNDPNPDSLIRLASVSPAANAITVSPTDIDLTFRDSIEGFTRRIVRDVVATVTDLPAVSGFPADAEINFVSNDFLPNSTVTVTAGSVSGTFTIVPPISFNIADPVVPGLSRVNPSQVNLVSAIETAITGIVTVTTASPHSLIVGNQVRISLSSAPACNGVWTVYAVLTATQFQFVKAGSNNPFTSTGGNVINTATLSQVFVTLAPGVTQNFTVGQPIAIINAIDPSFDVTSQVQTVVNSQVFTFQMVGFPTAVSGSGQVTEVGYVLPYNGVAIGDSTTSTASNFAFVFQSSTLAALINATPIGSSIQLQTLTPGAIGNTYTITKNEPGLVAGQDRIVLTGANFSGGADPISGVTNTTDLQPGDIYVVLAGEEGTLELWGYDGTIFRNLTSSSTATLLDFHRRNLFSNEKHLTDDQFNAVQGTVGTPSATNKFVTQEDTSVLTATLAAALAGADNVPPSGANRFLTEARYRGQRADIEIPATTQSFPYSSVNTSNNTIALASSGLLVNDSVIFSTTGTLPSVLIAGVTYYVSYVDSSSFSVAATVNGPTIALTNQGSGTHSVTLFGRNFVQLPSGQRWVVGNEVDSAIEFFNVVFTSTLKSAGGPTEYTQVSFDPVTCLAFYVTPALVTVSVETGLTVSYDSGPVIINSTLYSIVADTITLPSNTANGIIYVDTSGNISSATSLPAGALVLANYTTDASSIISLSTPNILNPADPLYGADDLAIYPTLDAPLLGNPVDLYVKLSAAPNNGLCSLLYSEAVQEKIRENSADMLMGPQRIVPAIITGIENKTAELTFNQGIAVSGTTLTFPATLFEASNLQDFTFRRSAGGQLVSLDQPFTIDFAAGSGTVGIVNSFTPIAFATANLWSRYLLTINQENLITVYPLSDYLESSTDQAFNALLADVALPNLALTQGQWLFATVAVQSNAANSSIYSLSNSSIELYPYQGSNSRDPGAPIICGDGVSSFGHFSGTAAHIAALAAASSGDTIKLLPGTYAGQWLITKPNLTIEFANGAALEHPVAMESLSIPATNFSVSGSLITSTNHGLLNGYTVSITTLGSLPTGLSSAVTYCVISATTNTFQLALTAGGAAVAFTTQGSGIQTISTTLTALNINAADVKVVSPRFINCSVGINLTANATEVEILDPQFETSVLRNFTGASSVGNTNTVFKYSNVATYTCSDGSSARHVGDFNSPNALNDAHSAASPGDLILVYPGTYSAVSNWSKNQIHVKGHGAGTVFIDGGGSSPSISISGSGNFFEDLVCTDASVGIECLSGAMYNTFSATVSFTASVIINVIFPTTTTGSGKHFNFHPLLSGNLSVSSSYSQGGKSLAVVTCGDGSSSWGDYTGADAINQAIAFENPGTTIRVGKGTYVALTGLTFNDLTIIGAGDSSVIQCSANVLGETAAINVVGNTNRISNFHLSALANNTVSYALYGVQIDGNDNIIEHLTFTEQGDNLIRPDLKYSVLSGIRNSFSPHTGAPSGMVSWTVGDGRRSFGDFVGVGGIGDALNSLPQSPQTLNGVLASPSGNTVTFTDLSSPQVVEFQNSASPLYIDTLYRYLAIQSGNATNQGSWKVTAVTGPTSLTLQRNDGNSFVAASNLVWSLVAGSKIWVLPGTYLASDFILRQNDVDIEAWGCGSDVIIQGGTPCIDVQGSRNRIAGFRVENSGGVGIQVTGKDNVFERNRFSSSLTTRYQIDAVATGNRIYDSYYNTDKTCYTVSSSPSRADFVGSTDTAIQAAVTAAAADPQNPRVYIGAGSYTLAATITVPASVTVFGSGYGTLLTSASASFPAFTLSSGGNQSITNIRFTQFTNALYGPATGVYAAGNWLSSCPINANVTGLITSNQ